MTYLAQYVPFLRVLGRVVAVFFALCFLGAALWYAVARILTAVEDRRARRRAIAQLMDAAAMLGLIRQREAMREPFLLCSVCSGAHRSQEDCPVWQADRRRRGAA